MKRSRLVAAAATSVVLVGTTAGLATAGHLNALLESDLSGRQEVAAGATNNKIVGDPDGSGEGYVFGIDNDIIVAADGSRTTVDNTDTLCYLITVEGIADLDQMPGAPRVAHIHEAARGENGPVVANLAFPTGGQAADCLSEDELNKFTTAAGPGIVQDILANPENYYFNVHNSEFPSGAIRGQLTAQGHDH